MDKAHKTLELINENVEVVRNKISRALTLVDIDSVDLALIIDYVDLIKLELVKLLTEE